LRIFSTVFAHRFWVRPVCVTIGASEWQAVQ